LYSPDHVPVSVPVPEPDGWMGARGFGAPFLSAVCPWGCQAPPNRRAHSLASALRFWIPGDLLSSRSPWIARYVIVGQQAARSRASFSQSRTWHVPFIAP